MIFRLFISLLFFLLGLEALFQELIPFLIAFLFVHVDLQSSVNHFDRQLLSAHLLYSCECNHTLCYMAEHRHSERSRSRSPRHHDSDRRDERREEVVPRFKLEETRTLLIEGGGADLSEAENVFRELSINIGTSLPDEVTADGNNLFVKYPSV